MTPNFEKKAAMYRHDNTRKCYRRRTSALRLCSAGCRLFLDYLNHHNMYNDIVIGIDAAKPRTHYASAAV